MERPGGDDIMQHADGVVLYRWRSQGLPGGQLAHPNCQNEEKNKESLRKNKKQMMES